MTPAYIAFKKWFALSIFGCALVATSVGLTNVYFTHIRLPDVETIIGVDRYPAYVTVESFDHDKQLAYLIIKSNLVTKDVVSKVWVAPDFYAERRDAIIDDSGIIIGALGRTPLPASDIKPGMRGLAVLRILDNGTLQLYYLQVGQPYPRP